MWLGVRAESVSLGDWVGSGGEVVLLLHIWERGYLGV